jgi:acyl-CoA thioesterase-1
MSFIVFLYASGLAFFVGAAMIVAAAFVKPSRFRWEKALAACGLLLFVAPSSLPVPWQMWAAAACVTLPWWPSANRRTLPRAMLIFFWIVAMVGEALFIFTPTVESRSPLRIAVVGDSLTSGLAETRATRWPELLSKRPGIVAVHDFAVEGATCRKAMAQAENVPEDATLVFVEIGGNDILGQTSLEEFRRDYDALLAKLWRPDRTLVGCELPLPPFHNGWGKVQRDIARKHGVKLIPKWRLMWILADPKNTVDTIHPTQAGQEAIAKLAAEVLRVQ